MANHIRKNKPTNVRLAQIIPLHATPERYRFTHDDDAVSPLLQYLMPSNDSNFDTKYISASSKKLLKDVWGNVSKIKGSENLFIKNDQVKESDLTKLKSLGLIISCDGDSIELTAKGNKVLKEVILNEESSLLSKSSKYKLDSPRYTRKNFKMGEKVAITYEGDIVDYAIPLPDMSDDQHYGDEADMPVLVVQKQDTAALDGAGHNNKVHYAQMTLEEAVNKMDSGELVSFAEINSGSAGTFSGGRPKAMPQTKWQSGWPGDDDE